MTQSNSDYSYVIVSPVKDEENYIEETIKSVIKQTVKPTKWIIVDDGSHDKTPEKIDEYCLKYEWIQRVRIERDRQRQPGSAIINAFNQGYRLIEKEYFDFIVKLDCDLRFDSNYFEQLLSKFKVNEKLGIASGIYYEKKDQHWVPIKMPDYHAAGASKVARKECFEQIGGFLPSRGWDTIDEIKAQTMGWETCHYKDLKMYHLKTEGSGIGRLHTNIMLGEIYYLTGGSKLFFLMKLLHRTIFSKPLVIGAFAMLFGYIKPLINRRELLVSREEAKFYKKLLNKRIINALVKFYRKEFI
jgi:poly-beta-1,6-N-acetyl-D-glucosamine synthase